MNVSTHMPCAPRARKPRPTPKDQLPDQLAELRRLEAQFQKSSELNVEELSRQIDELDVSIRSAPVTSAADAIAKLEYIEVDQDPFCRKILGDVKRYLRGVTS